MAGKRERHSICHGRTRDINAPECSHSVKALTYAHRYAALGKIESMCRTCYLTVARTNNEDEVRRQMNLIRREPNQRAPAYS